MRPLYKTRIDNLEREMERRRPPQPALVVIPSGDGYSAMGRRFDTVADAQAAYPERFPPIVVEVVDHSVA